MIQSLTGTNYPVSKQAIIGIIKELQREIDADDILAFKKLEKLEKNRQYTTKEIETFLNNRLSTQKIVYVIDLIRYPHRRTRKYRTALAEWPNNFTFEKNHVKLVSYSIECDEHGEIISSAKPKKHEKKGYTYTLKITK